VPPSVHAISGLSFAFIEAVRATTATADDTARLRHQLQEGELVEPWRLDDGLLLHGARIFVPAHDDLRHQALLLAHSAGHEGVQKTLHRLRADFFIPGDRTCSGLRVHMYNVLEEQDASPAAGRPTSAPPRAVPGVGGYLDGLHRGAAQGWREVGHLDGGGSLLQVRTLHRAQPPLYHRLRCQSLSTALYAITASRHRLSVIGTLPSPAMCGGTSSRWPASLSV